MKEPTKVHRSGNTYVAARLREDPSSDHAEIPIRRPKNCEHAATICATKDCYESWSIDWALFPHRTAGGRRLLAELKMESSSQGDDPGEGAS